MARNGGKWLHMNVDYWKWLEWLENAGKGWKCLDIAGMAGWLDMAGNDYKCLA